MSQCAALPSAGTVASTAARTVSDEPRPKRCQTLVASAPQDIGIRWYGSL